MIVLRLVVESDQEPARLALFGDDGESLAEWVQNEVDAIPELRRSHDGQLVSVVAGGVITVVCLQDGRIVARCPTGRAIAAVLPLDRTWTLELSGELHADGGHTGFHSRFLSFLLDADDDLDEQRAQVARKRSHLAAAARAGVHRRHALRCQGHEVLLHESTASPADGREVLLWPPVPGPEGVLVRHAIEVDDGNEAHTAPQRPWLVRPDRTVTQLPFELGVSPLTALHDGRWLLPGADTVWRDDYDEPLSILGHDGALEPLLVGGRPVPASRILREAAPELFSGLPPVAADDDVSWDTVSAREDTGAEELHLAFEIQPEDEVTVLVAALPLDGHGPARLVERFDPAPGRWTAVAP